ncbi:MAG: Wadjet anti-phage system protein JetA family protein [Candidatus Izemoplasmatales bacterium]|jgi:hypothetical protein|nr:DUF5716 family protein [Candidatus Izemoplasmatales bacterium]
MEIYKLIPTNFFAILNCKNQEIYVRCLAEIFKTYEQGSILGMEKSIAHQVVCDVLETMPADTIIEGDEELIDVRGKASAILRRFEECGWIDIDVSNDYVEIMNFRDYAITIIQALNNISQDTFYGYGDDSHEFRGYIYTVYTLLTTENPEFAMVLDQVYKNTIAFVREIRKLDSRLKFYIKTILDNNEIRDLISLLVNYKVELVDQAYYRLKTSDNVNKYKLEIIKRMEEYQSNDVIMDLIAKDYMLLSNNNYELAKARANKKVDDIIDIYNSLARIIDEIDNKNKIYVNSTIAKIKFLLNDDENVIGKLTSILKFTGNSIKKYKTDQALKTISPLFNIRTHRIINNNSLFTPRGIYWHAESQFLLENDITPSDAMQEAFYKEFETDFSEDVIKKYLNHVFEKQNLIKASELLTTDLSDEAVLRLLYILVYSGEEMNYFILPLPTTIKHNRFDMNDFQIIRGNRP